MGRAGLQEGARLRSGLYAVRVVAVRMYPTEAFYRHTWDIKLSCGCRLLRHRTHNGPQVPRFAGCPNGHSGPETGEFDERGLA